MFILRPEHEAAFEREGLARFCRWAVWSLRRHRRLETAGLTRDELASLVVAWCAEARSIGLLTERQMYRYFECALVLRQGSATPATDHTVRAILRVPWEDANERSARALASAESRFGRRPVGGGGRG